MITYEFEPYCEDCPDICPTSETIHCTTIGGEDGNVQEITVIQCVDREQCQRLVSRLKQTSE